MVRTVPVFLVFTAALAVAPSLAKPAPATPKPEDILQEAIDYFESEGGIRKIEKEDPDELSFEIKDDFTLGGVEAQPKVDAGRLLQAGKRYAETMVKEANNHREAVRMLRACRDLESRQGADDKTLRSYDFSIAASLAKCGEKEREEAVSMIEGILARGEEKIRCIKALFDAKASGRDPTPGYDWLEKALRENTFDLPIGYQQQLWDYFGFRAFYSMRRQLMERAIAGMESINRPFIAHGGMCVGAIKAFDDMENFPKPESEIKFPKTAADLGFDPDVKVVHAKDCDIWDDDDATGCLQEAIASDATTIIVDNVGKPWRIKGVSFPKTASNKRILFKKGVRVHVVDDGVSWHNTLFSLRGAKNIIFEGEEDVQIGHFATYEERRSKSKGEGGSGFGVGGSNIVLRNLKVSNCVCDALSLGDASNVYVEDCDFDCNYRQGASFGATRNIYFKNVKFRNTRGGEPGCGVDFEPYYEVYPNNNLYFFDCEFTDNQGQGMTFATSTYLPVTVYAKRCRFSSPGPSICIRARAGIYIINNAPAPSKVVFDECQVDGHSDSAPIRFVSSSLFNVTFTNCVIRDTGPVNLKRAQNHPPVLFVLDRAHWRGFCPLDGQVRFADCEITGFTNAPPIRFLQSYGAYGVTNISGSVRFNGKDVCLDGTNFRPFELDWDEVGKDLDFAAFSPPAAIPGPKDARAFTFRFGGAYYQAPPKYALLRWEEGKEPESAILNEKFLDARNGAYYAGACEDKTFRINCKPGFTGYFEVPAGKDCAVKLMGGGMEIRNAAGEVVARMKGSDYYGIGLLTFRATGDANEVFSFTCLNGNATFKFFAPLPGIWAEKPEWLPRRKE